MANKILEVDVEWKESRCAPVDEATKLQWINEMVDRLDRTGEPWEEIRSGDCMIHVRKTRYGYDIEEYRPTRYAVVES